MTYIYIYIYISIIFTIFTIFTIYIYIYIYIYISWCKYYYDITPIYTPRMSAMYHIPDGTNTMYDQTYDLMPLDSRFFLYRVVLVIFIIVGV